MDAAAAARTTRTRTKRRVVLWAETATRAWSNARTTVAARRAAGRRTTTTTTTTMGTGWRNARPVWTASTEQTTTRRQTTRATGKERTVVRSCGHSEN